MELRQVMCGKPGLLGAVGGMAMDQGEVQAAVQADLAANLGVINAGLNVRSITVAGQQITYNAFKLSDGVINVGRITLP